MRLNKFLAECGVCSRRKADEIIAEGRVTVNRKTVSEMGFDVDEKKDVVYLDGKKIVPVTHYEYIMFNKPKGCVTTMSDDKGRKTVYDFIGREKRLVPVGRLDYDSEGLLLFTNDGDLTRQLTHPSFQKKKIYQVSLDKPLTKADMEQIAQGITLEDGEIYADEIAYVKEDKTEVGIEIHSGRNRIVRRIFEFLGYTVTKLDRVYYAGLTKKNLKRGAWRFLTREEVERLKSGQYE